MFLINVEQNVLMNKKENFEKNLDKIEVNIYKIEINIQKQNNFFFVFTEVIQLIKEYMMKKKSLELFVDDDHDELIIFFEILTMVFQLYVQLQKV